MEGVYLPRKSEKSVKIGNIVTSNTPYRGKSPTKDPIYGGPSGDPYPIGGKRGMIPPASLSRVYSPPPAEGCHGAFGPRPTPKGGWCDPGTAHALRDEQGVHRPTVLCPPKGGPDGTPSIGGGVVL